MNNRMPLIYKNINSRENMKFVLFELLYITCQHCNKIIDRNQGIKHRLDHRIGYCSQLCAFYDQYDHDFSNPMVLDRIYRINR